MAIHIQIEPEDVGDQLIDPDTFTGILGCAYELSRKGRLMQWANEIASYESIATRAVVVALATAFKVGEAQP